MEFLVQSAWAQEGAPAGPSAFGPLLLVLFFFAMFYFLIIRPQAKRAKEHTAMVEALGKGDEVLTGGGILGRVVDVEGDFVTVQVAANTKLKVQKRSIGALMPKGTFKE